MVARGPVDALIHPGVVFYPEAKAECLEGLNKKPIYIGGYRWWFFVEIVFPPFIWGWIFLIKILYIIIFMVSIA